MMTFFHGLWASAERLSDAITLANWGIATSLLLGFLFTAFVIIAGNRKDELNDVKSKAQDVRIAEAQRGAAEATATAKQFESKIADSDARVKAAEAQIASADAASKDAVARVAEAQHASAEASAKAEGFRLDIAKAQAQVAGAVAEAAKANLELAKLKTPRTLSKEQLGKIRVKIAPFTGTPFDLWVNTDSDSTTLLDLIDETLRSAGWKFSTPGNPIMFAEKAGIIASSGVAIHVPEEHQSEWGPAILALRDAFIAEGIPAGAFEDAAEAEKGKSRDRVHVMIGSKPLN